MKPLSPVPASLLTGGSRESFLRGKANDLKGACREFEALFMEQVLKSMRRTIMKSGLFDGGVQQDIYQDLFAQQVARALAQGKGTGIGEMLYQQLSRAQGGKDDGR